MKRLLRTLALGVLAVTIAAPALHSQASKAQKKAAKAALKAAKKQQKAQNKALKKSRKRAMNPPYPSY